MSFLSAAKAIKATTRTSTEKLVLIIISDCISDETGIAWPSIDYIAEHAMCSPRTAQRAVKSLVNQGILEAEEKSGRSSIYSISESLNVSVGIPTPFNVTDPSQIDGGDTSVRGGVSPMSGGGDTRIATGRASAR